MGGYIRCTFGCEIRAFPSHIGGRRPCLSSGSVCAYGRFKSPYSFWGAVPNRLFVLFLSCFCCYAFIFATCCFVVMFFELGFLFGFPIFYLLFVCGEFGCSTPFLHCSFSRLSLFFVVVVLCRLVSCFLLALFWSFVVGLFLFGLFPLVFCLLLARCVCLFLLFLCFLWFSVSLILFVGGISGASGLGVYRSFPLPFLLGCNVVLRSWLSPAVLLAIISCRDSVSRGYYLFLLVR